MILLSKLGSIRKKLLVGLCAFASGVGGAGAALQNTSTSEGLRLIHHAKRSANCKLNSFLYDDLSNDVKTMYSFLVDLKDGNGTTNVRGKASVLQAFSASNSLNDTARNSKFEVKNSVSGFDFLIFTERYKGAARESGDYFDSDPVLSFRVETEYIASRLVSKGWKIVEGHVKKGETDVGDVTNFKCMDNFVANNLAVVDLYDIAMNDVMGLDMPAYGASAGGYDVNANVLPALSQASHPDFTGCWTYFLRKCFIPLIGGGDSALISTFDLQQSGENGYEIAADRKQIFEKFFGNGSKFKTRNNGASQPQGSDYYRNMWKAPQQVISKVMGAGGKTGVAFGVIGTVGVLGSVWYTYREHNESQQMRNFYEEELERKRGENESLQSRLNKWNKVEKLAKLKNSKTFFSLKRMADNGGSGVKGKFGGRKRSNSASNNIKR